MSIEEFMRGCFDVGFEARVMLEPHGEWGILVYDHVSPDSHRFKRGHGRTFAEALADYNDAQWQGGFAVGFSRAAETIDELRRTLGPLPDEGPA